MFGVCYPFHLLLSCTPSLCWSPLDFPSPPALVLCINCSVFHHLKVAGRLPYLNRSEGKIDVNRILSTTVVFLHFPRNLTSFTRRVMVIIRHVRSPSWTNKKDLPYWEHFLNNLKKTSKTDRNVGFKYILTSEIPGNNSNFNFMLYN